MYSSGPGGFSLYADLDGTNALHDGVIPPHILVTNLKPDFSVTKVVVILVLTLGQQHHA